MEDEWLNITEICKPFFDAGAKKIIISIDNVTAHVDKDSVVKIKKYFFNTQKIGIENKELK